MINLEWYLVRAQSEEMLHLDLARLIASIGIVAHHSIEFFVPVTDRTALTEKTMGLALFVDLFFAISGFVIAYVYHERALSGAGYLKFLQRRLGRLVPLHWLTLFISMLVWLAFLLLGYGGNHPPSFQPACIIETAVLVHSFVGCDGYIFNGVSWSISTEMVMYVVAFPVIAIVATRYRWAPIVGLIGGLCFLVWKEGPAVWWWVDVNPLLRAIPSFCFGAALFYNGSWVSRLPAPALIFTVSMTALVITMATGAPHLIELFLAYTVVAAAVAADYAVKPASIVKKLAPFGQLTYSIYMWHGLFILVVMNAIGDKLLHARPIAMIPLAAVCWGAIALASYVSFSYIENPARRWVDGLFPSA